MPRTAPPTSCRSGSCRTSAASRPNTSRSTSTRESKRGRLRLVASPDGRDGSLTLHADASIRAGLFDGDESAELALDPKRRAWVQVVRGQVVVNGQPLGTGDAAGLEQESSLQNRRRRAGGSARLRSRLKALPHFNGKDRHASRTADPARARRPHPAGHPLHQVRLREGRRFPGHRRLYRREGTADAGRRSRRLPRWSSSAAASCWRSASSPAGRRWPSPASASSPRSCSIPSGPCRRRSSTASR